VNILVGIDFSDCTNTVVRKAQEIAQALSAKVWLLHVAEPEPAFVGYEVGPQYERDALSEKLHKEHADIQALGDELRDAGLEATALLVRGSTVETILNEATKLEADMIIVGSHGRGAVQRLLVGSVSEGVLRHAKCPMLIIPTL
jgi:nucleotide-binding universal stress UspA family protein